MQSQKAQLQRDAAEEKRKKRAEAVDDCSQKIQAFFLVLFSGAVFYATEFYQSVIYGKQVLRSAKTVAIKLQ